MNKTDLNSPAYQGRGWQRRSGDLRGDLARERGLWSPCQVNSEWSALKAVVLYKPGKELRDIRDPRRAQHLRAIDLPRLRTELEKLAQTYRRLGIEVIWIEPTRLPAEMRAAPPNLMFVRDLFFNTPEGAILSRMASRVRAGEEKFAAATLAAHGIPILHTMGGDAVFEGADALWLDPRTVLCGVGNRTNPEARRRLARWLADQDVNVVEVPMPKGVQHLLGILQIAGKDSAVVRSEKTPSSLARLLRARGFRLLELEESNEVTARQGMNFVTVRERTIVMAHDCPTLRRRFEDFGLKIAAQVRISQLLNAAGGIACATGILARKALS